MYLAFSQFYIYSDCCLVSCPSSESHTSSVLNVTISVFYITIKNTESRF